MSPRRRLKRNKSLPDNVYPYVSKGREYYRYKHPITGKMYSLGSDKSEALANARILNSRLMAPENKVNDILTDNVKNVLFSKLIEKYENDRLPAKELKKSTRDHYERRLNRLKKDKPNWIVSDVTTSDIATYLDENFERDSYIKHRSMLFELFQYSINKGYRQDNPVGPTESKAAVKKVRKRLTLEQFKAIYDIAPEYMKIAMELGLLTLQGRYEVINMKFSDVKDGYLYVIREKTSKNEWAKLRIKMNPALEAIKSRSKKSGVISPYFVHRKPERIKESEERDHWTKLTLNDFSKRFREIRDETGLFKHLNPKQRPSFHEIRSLGSWLYEKQGFENSDIQRLMAHADEKMTEYYQSGHEDKWMDVEASLDISTVLKNSAG